MNSAERFINFYEEQPPLLFVNELKKSIHEKKPENFTRTESEADEVFVSGAYIINEFADEENLLEIAFDDFNLFLDIYEIKGNGFPIYIRKEKTDCFAEWYSSWAKYP